MQITCCKDCVAPKRHVGCHATCKEYIEQRAEFEECKQKTRESLKKVPRINNFEFEKVTYVDLRRKKSK